MPSQRAPDEYKLSFWDRVYRSLKTSEPDRRYIQRREEIVLKRTAGRRRQITLSGGSVKIEKIGDLGGATNSHALVSPRGVDRASYVAASRRGIRSIAGRSPSRRCLNSLDCLRSMLTGSGVRDAHATHINYIRMAPRIFAEFLHWLSQDHPDRFELLREDVQFVLPGL